MVTILNPTSHNRGVLGCLLLCTELENPDVEVENPFNIHYFSQLVYHVQMVISNYEKLYYLVDTFSELMVARDMYMPYHMTNVANKCVLLGSVLNLSYKNQQLLYFSALLHDVGKLFVPESIINKPSKLTESEYVYAKSHAIKGEEILRTTLHGMTFLDSIPTIIRHHHERYDGSGYPDGIKGEKIPLISRIITVADSVDAMMSRRAYKDKESLERIITELKVNSGTQFDPLISEAMIEMLLNEKSKLRNEENGKPKFIPNCALGFIYMDKTMISLTGNLILEDTTGVFVVHDSHYKVYAVNSMLNTTVCYFENDEIKEFRVIVSQIENGKFYLNKIIVLPTDKTFSMIWSSKITIIDKDTEERQLVDLVNLGGDSVVISIDNTSSWIGKLSSRMNGNYEVLLNETVENIYCEFILGIKIIKYYKGNKHTFICRFTDIKPNQKDRILRLLFRKQMLLNQEKSKLY